MSSNLTPALSGPSTALTASAPAAVAPARADGAAAPVPTEAQLGRILAALGRYKWLIAALAVAGAGAGIAASRFVEPTYVVQSSILITGGLSGQDDDNRGPLTSQVDVNRQGWVDLLRTGAIADSVVLKLALYVEPENARDSTLFRDFALNFKANRFVPGQYTLQVTGPRYTLRDKLGLVSEQGVAGDSIGRPAGFAWAPSAARLGRNRTVKFTVHQPREASVDILSRLTVRLAKGSNLIFMSLTGTAQQKPAETLNAWNEQFIRIATDLKTARSTQSSKALASQRDTAAQRLAEIEQQYTQFRVNTATLPSEALAIGAGAAGTGAQIDPALSNYTASKYQLEALSRDRRQLETVAATVRGDSVPVEALLNVGLVNTDPAATTLRTALTELLQTDAQVRTLRRTLQDVTPPLRGILEQRHTLATQTVPQALNAFLGQLRTRERLVGGVVAEGGQQLRQIPERTSRLDALARDREAAARLFTTLNSRYTEAQLVEQSMTPDVRVLDTAVQPLEASQGTLSKLLTVGLAAGLALGLGLAVLLDRFDRRFRYPVQVTHDLGLQILGIVPEIDQSREPSPERVVQIVEGFRSLRMNVRYACAPSPKVTLTVTSPGPGDGKSLVASNLALSFAEGGWRTVIVDGDLRRGRLNTTFGVPNGPGLVGYLEGTSLLGEVLQPTAHENLSIVTTGAKHRRGPELLGTPRMQQLIAALAAEYDAVIVDSPPLGAGIDAYALGTATANVALVLRRASTDVKMAEAKLQALDALPVQVLGAVLNEVDADAKMYQYFAYDPDYVLVEGEQPAEEAGRLTAAT